MEWEGNRGIREAMNTLHIWMDPGSSPVCSAMLQSCKNLPSEKTELEVHGMYSHKLYFSIHLPQHKMFH